MNEGTIGARVLNSSKYELIQLNHAHTIAAMRALEKCHLKHDGRIAAAGEQKKNRSDARISLLKTR